jgi:ribosome maturation factor RimP
MAQRNRAGGRAPARPARDAGRAQGGRAGGSQGDGPAAGTGSGRGDLAAHRTRLRAVIGPVIEHAGYDLEDLAVSRAGRRHLLRVIVDGDGGVNLDVIAELSREISAALDAAESAGGEFTSGEYVLEVSSPGVDRPLTESRHWRRSIGRLVAVRAGEAQVTGRVLGADSERVTLDLNGASREVPYGQLGPGRVQIEFSRLDEAGDDESGDDELGDDDMDELDELADFDEEREEDEE